MEIPADYQRICKMLYYLWMCESGPSSERKGEVGCNSRALSVLWLLLTVDSSLLQGWAGVGVGGAFCPHMALHCLLPVLGSPPKRPTHPSSHHRLSRVGLAGGSRVSLGLIARERPSFGKGFPPHRPLGS